MPRPNCRNGAGASPSGTLKSAALRLAVAPGVSDGIDGVITPDVLAEIEGLHAVISWSDNANCFDNRSPHAREQLYRFSQTKRLPNGLWLKGTVASTRLRQAATHHCWRSSSSQQLARCPGSLIRVAHKDLTRASGLFCIVDNVHACSTAIAKLDARKGPAMAHV